MKSLTIAIPTYKSEQTLFRLLESILLSPNSQGVVSEVLISDNDPDSEIRQNLESKYSDQIWQNIRYIKNETNLGYDGNLANLAYESTSEITKFIADDDLVTDNFFKSMERILSSEVDFDIILHNFQGVSDSGEFRPDPIFLPENFLKLSPEWRYEQIISLEGKFGQISSLAFKTNRIRDLVPKIRTNFIHLFWFYSILETSTIIFEQKPTIIVVLGSPNFSKTKIEVLTVPRGAILALEHSQLRNSSLRKSLLLDATNYCLNLLKDCVTLRKHDRVKVIRHFRKELMRSPLMAVKLVPYFVTPSAVYGFFSQYLKEK